MRGESGSRVAVFRTNTSLRFFDNLMQKRSKSSPNTQVAHMDQESLIEHAKKSQRIRTLMAACIQGAIRTRFGRSISSEDARDLALVHTSSSLVSELQETIDVKIGLPDEHAQFRHMVQEAKFGRGNLRAVIAARRKLLESTGSLDLANAGSESVRLRLLIVAQDASKWQRDYSAFLDLVSMLYNIRKKQLIALKLPEESLFKALVMLEAAVSDAIWQST